MADVVVAPEGGVAPAAPVVPVVPAAPPAPPAPQHADPEGPWLKPRLDSAKATGAKEREAALLAEAGVPDVATLKTILADHKAKVDASKTAEQKAAELTAQLASLTAEKASIQAQRDALVAEQASTAAQLMAVLSPEDQGLVKQLSGDDPVRQNQVIEALNRQGKIKLSGDAPRAPIPAPATSTQVTPAPPPPGANPQPNHLATYSDLEKRNPVAAAHYLIANFDAIQKAKQATT
jgi:hypothetical protein